jgi:hypothetical protein
MLKNKLMLYPQTATVNHPYIEGSRLVDKVLKKTSDDIRKSNLELTEKTGRLHCVRVPIIRQYQIRD